MNCPRCRIQMRAGIYRGVRIDKCPQCHGVWVDNSEIIRIIQAKGVRLNPRLINGTLMLGFAGKPEGYEFSAVRCPVCQLKMMTINYDYSGGVIIDRCVHSHGLWFDGTELQKVKFLREQINVDYDTNRREWIKLVSSAAEDEPEPVKSMSKANMRPTKYLATRIIKTLLAC